MYEMKKLLRRMQRTTSFHSLSISTLTSNTYLSVVYCKIFLEWNPIFNSFLTDHVIGIVCVIRGCCTYFSLPTFIAPCVWMALTGLINGESFEHMCCVTYTICSPGLTRMGRQKISLLLMKRLECLANYKEVVNYSTVVSGVIFCQNL